MAQLMRELGRAGVRRGRRGPHHPRPGCRQACDLVRRHFSAPAPDRLWVADFERHEALSNRVEVGDLRRRVVAAAW